MDSAPDGIIEVTAADGAAKLESRILCWLAGRIGDVRVVVADEAVTLRGQVHTYYAKQLAQHAVMTATDLPIRANDLRVS